MNSSFFIAFRYLFAKKKHNVINVISAISTIAMTIGTAALIIILSVFNGFDEIIKDNLSDIDPDIRISRIDSRRFDPNDSLFDFLYDKFDCVSPILEENVYLSYNERQSIAKARGVESLNPELEKHLVNGEFSLYFGELPEAMLGLELAQSLGVNPRFSEKIEFFFPSNPSAGLFGINSIKVLPSGLFSLNSVIDKELIIIPIETLRELLEIGDLVSCLEIKSSDCGKKTLKELSDTLGPEYKVENSEMINSSLFKMMNYEKLALYAILIFVVVIIAFNLYASLSMLVLEKREDIFHLSAMGLSERKIRNIFVSEGFLTSLLGALCGLVLGLILCWLQMKFGIFKMPSGFLVSAYPCVLKLGDVLLSFLGVSLVGAAISLVFSTKITTFMVLK